MFRCSEKAYEQCKDKDCCGERPHTYYLTGSQCEKFNIEVAQKGIKERDNWIRVEDKLPPNNQAVLAYCTGTARQGDLRCVAMYQNGFWFLQNSEARMGFLNLQYEVTQWQSLPEPPKGE